MNTFSVVGLLKAQEHLCYIKKTRQVNFKLPNIIGILYSQHKLSLPFRWTWTIISGGHKNPFDLIATIVLKKDIYLCIPKKVLYQN